MFTGIIRDTGTVALNRGKLLALRPGPRFGRRPGLGASVAVNGVCLTVARLRHGRLEFEMSPETLARTNLGTLRPGDRVNLEPSLRAGDELGGHWVSGHVDARSEVLEAAAQPGGFRRLRLRLPAELKGLVAFKGSVAIDGTSLTVTRVARGWFETVLVPHTMERTTLGGLGPRDPVNLEADMLARYVRAVLRGGA